jgi:branched-chain amino acid transport system substrate-binding protein
MKRTALLVAAALFAAAAVVVTAGAAPTATPGVTSRTILLEGTFPLSGPASGYAPIPSAMKAYFSYVNAQHGVNGRQIVFKFDDDGYNPATTVQITHKYVEQDHAFALVGGLGTEPQQAVEAYLNQQKVPQLFVSTGATTFDHDYAKYPWSIGWQPDYAAEGVIYGKYIAQHLPNAKIGVIYQNDDYGGNYLSGFKAGLGSHTSEIVSAQPFDVTSPSPLQQIEALAQSGADTLVIFVTPTATIQSYVIATKLGWTPKNVFTNSVSATSTFLGIAAQSGSTITGGTFTVNYLLDPTNPTYNSAPGMKLYRQIMAKYDPKGNVNDQLNVYGMAKAWNVVQLLQQAGKNLTRAGLMAEARSMNFAGSTADPFLLPGIVIHTKGGYQYPISQVNLVQFTNGVFKPIGGLIEGRAPKKGQ